MGDVMATTAGSTTDLRTVRSADGMVLAYRELGAGPPVLVLHGWPTSSYLWRRVMGPLARRHRVVALDLPGFGGSDKPTGVRYSFGIFERAIDGFLVALQIDGEIGVADPAAISEQVVAAVTDPFTGGDDRLALAAAGIGLSVRGFTEKAVRKKPRNGIATSLRWLKTPIRAVYGEADRILPDVAETMPRLQRAVPAAVVTGLPGMGHFVQEEVPDVVGELLDEFFGADDTTARPGPVRTSLVVLSPMSTGVSGCGTEDNQIAEWSGTQPDVVPQSGIRMDRAGYGCAMKKLMFAALVGAAVMWFYDPANGSRRREALQRKLNGGPSGSVTPMRLADSTPPAAAAVQ